MAWSAPSHYLNQCWNIVNLTLRNKLQWNFNRYSYIFIQENIFQNIWEMSATIFMLIDLSRGLSQQPSLSRIRAWVSSYILQFSMACNNSSIHKSFDGGLFKTSLSFEINNTPSCKPISSIYPHQPPTSTQPHIINLLHQGGQQCPIYKAGAFSLQGIIVRHTKLNSK